MEDVPKTDRDLNADPDLKVDVAVDDSTSQNPTKSDESLKWRTTRIELWSFYLYYIGRAFIS